MLEFVQQKIEADKSFARLEILDSLAAQFKSTPDLSTLVSQLTEKAGSLTEDAQKSAGELYVKYGQKAAEKVNSKGFLFVYDFARLDPHEITGHVRLCTELGQTTQYVPCIHQ